MAHAFISYRRKPSTTLAHLIQKELAAHYDLDVYLDTTRTDSASVQFPDRLLNAIDSAEVFVCLLADTTLDSEWVLREIERAYANKKPCIPVFQESFQPKNYPQPAVAYLLQFDAVHIFEQKGLFIDAAIADLAGLIKKTVAPKRRLRGGLVGVGITAALVVIALAVSSLLPLGQLGNRTETTDEAAFTETFAATQIQVLPTATVSTETTPTAALVTQPSATPTASATAILLPTATQTNPPTPTPSSVPTQTFTPSLTTTSTNTPAPSATITPEATIEATAQLVVSVDSANLRSGPSTAYQVVGNAVQGERLTILAQAYNSTWFLVIHNEGQPVWISASITELDSTAVSIPTALTIPAPPPTVALRSTQASVSGGSTGDVNEVRHNIPCDWATGTLVRQNGFGEAIAYDAPNGVALSGIFPGEGRADRAVGYTTGRCAQVWQTYGAFNDGLAAWVDWVELALLDGRTIWTRMPIWPAN